ncbi:MAG: class I SAM-dependent methyltransferase [Lutibacter sp.]|uniref:O-methyltransferase n=1 Tax=Lutibacter sp. TaxID=1925666 RepID=UPI0038597657
MWFKVKSFILFLFKSTNQHGVHSPFVYNLITNCFYSKTNSTKIILVKNMKQWLKSNNKIITVTDFGSGSKIFKNNERKVSEIAKVAGINLKKSLLLIRIIDYFQPQNVLEIGTSVGLSSATISVGNSTSHIKTLEGCKNTAAVAKQLFTNFNLENIKITVGNFNKTLPLIIKNKKFDLIYFDGNHQKEATLYYFNLCVETVHNNSVFIFDDIHWSSEMQEAWLIIKNHPKVTISINTYFWGIIFFRKEQEKEHFTIRV